MPVEDWAADGLGEERTDLKAKGQKGTDCRWVSSWTIRLSMWTVSTASLSVLVTDT